MHVAAASSAMKTRDRFQKTTLHARALRVMMVFKMSQSNHGLDTAIEHSLLECSWRCEHLASVLWPDACWSSRSAAELGPRSSYLATNHGEWEPAGACLTRPRRCGGLGIVSLGRAARGWRFAEVAAMTT